MRDRARHHARRAVDVGGRALWGVERLRVPRLSDSLRGILIAVGRWTEAEEELLAAIRAFERSYRAMRASPLAKLADLRVRQGRLDEARRLLEGNESHPVARRVLATIALARGEVVLEDLARLCLDGEAASDPGCVPALELLVQIRLARDDVRAANEALKLTDLAASSGDGRAAAFAQLAAGRASPLALAEDCRAFLVVLGGDLAAGEAPVEDLHRRLGARRSGVGTVPV